MTRESANSVVVSKNGVCYLCAPKVEVPDLLEHLSVFHGLAPTIPKPATVQRVTRDASNHVNAHIMQEGDPTGHLALAIDLLDHHLDLPCPVCDD